jgi:hypothetical protein
MYLNVDEMYNTPSVILSAPMKRTWIHDVCSTLSIKTVNLDFIFKMYLLI